MKTNIILTINAVLSVAAFAQGPLTPPGAPGPTMKTLGEIFDQGIAIQQGVNALKSDPRTVITTAPYSIIVPGSYVLGANLSVMSGDAITITTSNVTFDLNGFTISSSHVSGSGSAILVAGSAKGVLIRNGGIESGTTVGANGSVSPAGFLNGVYNGFATAGMAVSQIRVHGVAQFGIGIGTGTDGSAAVDRCDVSDCGAHGIWAHTVTTSNATNCADTAIYGSIVRDCTGISVSSSSIGHGINAKNVTNSVGTSASGIGIRATTVSDSSGKSAGTTSAGDGIQASTVESSAGTASDGSGINANVVINSTGVSASGVGILAAASVFNSVGSSTSGTAAISSTGTVSYSFGKKLGGTAISADIAIGCTVIGGTVSSPSKHLGTP